MPVVSNAPTLETPLNVIDDEELAVQDATTKFGLVKVMPTEFRPTGMALLTAPTGAVATDWALTIEDRPKAAMAANRAREGVIRMRIRGGDWLEMKGAVKFEVNLRGLRVNSYSLSRGKPRPYRKRHARTF